MPKPSDEGCSSCTFFNTEGDPNNPDTGYCLRHAPRPSEVSGYSHWPYVRLTNWCGEWVADKSVVSPPADPPPPAAG